MASCAHLANIWLALAQLLGNVFRQLMPGSGVSLADYMSSCRFFMSIGSVIRNEPNNSAYHAVWARAHGQPFMIPRQYRLRPHVD